MDSIVAIDFETLYPALESACAVGMVKIVDGFVAGRFYSLVKPPAEVCTGRVNTDIHGISEEMLVDSPFFPDVFPIINLFMEGAVPVAHNARVERCCIRKCCNFYGIDVPAWVDQFVDTYELTGESLVKSCSICGIPVENHHDALQDAWMCAQVFMSLSGQSIKQVETHERIRRRIPRFAKGLKVERDDLVPLSPDDVTFKKTPFFQKHVLYTGSFEWFPNRCDIGHQLKLLGAIVEREWTARTEVLLVGRDAGPKKMEKAAAKGIPIVDEKEFYDILSLTQTNDSMPD